MLSLCMFFFKSLVNVNKMGFISLLPCLLWLGYWNDLNIKYFHWYLVSFRCACGSLDFGVFTRAQQINGVVSALLLSTMGSYNSVGLPVLSGQLAWPVYAVSCCSVGRRLVVVPLWAVMMVVYCVHSYAVLCGHSCYWYWEVTVVVGFPGHRVPLTIHWRTAELFKVTTPFHISARRNRGFLPHQQHLLLCLWQKHSRE